LFSKEKIPQFPGEKKKEGFFAVEGTECLGSLSKVIQNSKKKELGGWSDLSPLDGVGEKGKRGAESERGSLGHNAGASVTLAGIPQGGERKHLPGGKGGESSLKKELR